MQNAVKVLIVEDEPHALMGLAELISGWGYRTETARDGIEGWEKVLAWEPAIVVTDLKMPRMDAVSYTHLDVYKRQECGEAAIVA